MSRYARAPICAVIAPAIGYGIAPIQPKSPRRQACSRRRLEALIFAHINQMLYFFDGFAVKPGCDAIRHRGLIIHQHLQDAIKHRIGWQAVFIFLIRAQLGAGGFVDDARINDHTLRSHHPVPVMRVAPPADVKHPRLIQILNRIIPARHIAIDGRIADRDLRFIACGQQHMPKFIGQRHQQQAAQARLDIFLR